MVDKEDDNYRVVSSQFFMLALTGMAFICLHTSIVMAQESERATSSLDCLPKTAAEIGAYWTDERMKKALPMPMPQPEASKGIPADDGAADPPEKAGSVVGPCWKQERGEPQR